jgi:hypothetical protein
VVAEAKADTVSLDTADVQGQMLQQGIAVLQSQPLRHSVHGFSFNANFIQFYEITRGNAAYRVVGAVKVSPLLSWGGAAGELNNSGAEWFAKMLAHFRVPPRWEVELTACMLAAGVSRLLGVLGGGATSVVYSAEVIGCDSGQAFALKVLKDGFNSSAWVEASTLRKLLSSTVDPTSSDSVTDCIPAISSSSDDGAAQSAFVLMAPVGTPFDVSYNPFTVRHGVEILRVLRAAHRADIVHLDIRPTNILRKARSEGVVAVAAASSASSRLYKKRRSNGVSNALVIDWGFAVAWQSSLARPFRGTVRYASPRVIQSRLAALVAGAHVHMHTAHPVDDLYSWVRTCFAMTYPSVQANLRTRPHDDAMTVTNLQQLSSWWDSVLIGWSSIIDVLNDVDARGPISDGVYDGLEAMVAALLLPDCAVHSE